MPNDALAGEKSGLSYNITIMNNNNRNPDLCENSGEQAMPITNSNIGGMAPQATSTIGIPEPPPATIEATGSVGAVTVLNPFGPSNQLNQGAIVFAYPDLIYDQFIDVNQQIEITDDTSPGTLILQIPYHPISDYTNQYIQNYASLHGRYNGDILIRAQIIGNATFSGTLIWFWYPIKYPSAIVDMSAAQKYSYKTQSVVMPSVEEFILKDARQYQYYRSMDDTDIDTRPHLCLAVHTSVVSPLREGIRVRLRIGSRLASRTDVALGKPVQPFMFADPQIVAYNPIPSVQNLNGRTISAVFPHYMVNDLFMYADGITTLPSYSTTDSDNMEIPFLTRAPFPGLFGGVFGTTANDRMVSSAVISNGNDLLVRVVLVNHQLPNNVAKQISTDTNFTNLAGASNFPTPISDAVAIQQYVTIYAQRNNTAVVNIFSGTESLVTMVLQSSCVTNYGRMDMYGLQIIISGASSPSEAITFLSPFGIPDTAAGTPLNVIKNGVLGPVSLTQDLVALPTTWVALKLSTEAVSIVASATDVSPTTLTATDLLIFFDNLASGLSADQCLQLDLVNPESRTRVATLRYLPARRDFVINPTGTLRYTAFNGSVSSLIIANYGIVPTASTFPPTDMSTWSNRVAAPPTTFSSRLRRSVTHYTPNAAKRTMETIANSLNETAEYMKSRMAPKKIIESFEMRPLNPTVPLSIINRNTVVGRALEQLRTSDSVSTSSVESLSEVPKWYEQLEDWSFDPLRPMSLVSLMGMVHTPNTNFKPNAMAAAATALAGSVASSVVSSGINWAHDESILHEAQAYGADQAQKNREQQMAMQQGLFGQQRSLQYADIMNKRQMQASEIANQQQMQLTGFANQRMMQQDTFRQQKALQTSEFAQQQQMGRTTYGYQKDLLETGLVGNILNTATGGVFGLAETALNTVGSAYLQKQDYLNQSKLMTQKANQQIQISGAGAAAMRLANVR